MKGRPMAAQRERMMKRMVVPKVPETNSCPWVAGSGRMLGEAKKEREAGKGLEDGAEE